MKYLNKKALIPTLLAVLFLLSSCRNPNDQPATENEITEGGETIILEITSEEPATTSATTSATTESVTTIISAATEEPETEPPEPETTTSVSETAESQTTAATTELTTVTTEETTVEIEETTVTETEIEAIEGLPDMVFAYLYCSPGAYDTIYGSFISNRGLVKKFKIELVFTDFNDRYANYPFFRNQDDAYYGSNLIREQYAELIETSIDADVNIEKNELAELYSKLLAVDIDSDITGVKVTIPNQNVDLEFENFYGIRTNEGGGVEIILLGGSGDMDYTNSDSYANALYEYFEENIFVYRNLDKWEEDFE